MLDQLESLRKSLLQAVSDASSVTELDEVETKYLGRKGELTSILRQLGSIGPDERKSVGSRANEVKLEGEAVIADRRQTLSSFVHAGLANSDWADVTEPGARPPEGSLHLMTQTMRKIRDIFSRIGFYQTRYPEIDWDWYAFESLNMDADHPARDNWETFFLDVPSSDKGGMVLTPHTSNAQGHELEKHEFPIRMLNIAKCYRRQSDVTHAPMFHQFEGLYVSENASMANLVGIVRYFVLEFFGPERKFRLRPHHFRFTEPSFEVDVSCDICKGVGVMIDGGACRLCKRGWMEIGGCGMTHPNVLRASGIDPEKYKGLAFGWGIERLAMMKDDVSLPDIRILYKNDLRFLKQF